MNATTEVMRVPRSQQLGVKILRSVASFSNCQRAAIGCVLLNREGNVLAAEANGSSHPACCQRPDEMGNCGCLHAEVRAAIRRYMVGDPHTAIVSISPCERCAKVLMEIGVKEVLYLQPSRVHEEGKHVILSAGAQLIQIAEE